MFRSPHRNIGHIQKRIGPLPPTYVSYYVSYMPMWLIFLTTYGLIIIEQTEQEKHSGSSPKNALKSLPTKASILLQTKMNNINNIESRPVIFRSPHRNIGHIQKRIGPLPRTYVSYYVSYMPMWLIFLTTYGLIIIEQTEQEKHSGSSPKNALKSLPTKASILLQTKMNNINNIESRPVMFRSPHRNIGHIQKRIGPLPTYVSYYMSYMPMWLIFLTTYGLIIIEQTEQEKHSGSSPKNALKSLPTKASILLQTKMNNINNIEIRPVIFRSPHRNIGHIQKRIGPLPPTYVS